MVDLIICVVREKKFTSNYYNLISPENFTEPNLSNYTN